jgi:sulfur-oxidizing protein SoxY
MRLEDTPSPARSASGRGGITRRDALAAAGGALAGFGAAPPARAENDYAEQIARFTGGKEPVAGRVALELPELAENGNTVPLAVSIAGPMSAESHVAEILILAPANPNARVARLRFSPHSLPEAATRIRLAESQSVIAIAKMSDGQFFSAIRPIKVTIGGCGG